MLKRVLSIFIVSILLIGLVYAVQGSNTTNQQTDSQANINSSKNQLNTSENQQNKANSTQIKEQNQINTSTSNKAKNIVQAQNRLRIQLGECPSDCSCSGSTIKCELGNGTGRQMTIMAGNSGNIIVQVKGQNMSTNVSLYKSEGKIYGNFKGNITKEINATPDQVKEKIQERLKQKNCSCNITLNEEGVYQVKTQKKARLFYIIPVKEKIQAQVSAESGELIKTRTSWWGFLARDIKEE